VVNHKRYCSSVTRPYSPLDDSYLNYCHTPYPLTIPRHPFSTQPTTRTSPVKSRNRSHARRASCVSFTRRRSSSCSFIARVPGGAKIAALFQSGSQTVGYSAKVVSAVRFAAPRLRGEVVSSVSFVSFTTSGLNE